MQVRSLTLALLLAFPFITSAQYTPAQKVERSIIDLSGAGIARAHPHSDTRGGGPPPNDLCMNAVVHPLSVGQTVVVNGNNTGATDTEGFGHANVWESFSLADCASVTVSYCGTTPPFPLVYSILTNVGCPGQVAIQRTDTGSCGDGNVVIYFANLLAGEYHVPILLEPGVSEGPYTLTFTAAACDVPPVNDRCTDAITVPVVQDCSQGGTTYGNNGTAVQNGGPPMCDSTMTQIQDVWYQFNSGMDTVVLFTLGTGTTGDLGIEVLTGCGGISLLCARGDTSYTMAVDTNTVYKVKIFSNNDYGQGGTFSLCISSASAATCNGGTVTGPLGESQLSVCSNSGPVPVEFNTSSTSASTYTYMLCTAGDTIISVLADSVFDFAGYPDGTYHVWGVSHSGTLTGADPGAAIPDVTSTDGCSLLSTGLVQVDVGICQGIGASNESTWIVYPNPSNGTLYLVNKGDACEATIDLIDIAGRSIHSRREMMERGAMRSFDTEGRVAPGSYSIRITSDNGSSVRRVVVE